MIDDIVICLLLDGGWGAGIPGVQELCSEWDAGIPVGSCG